MQSTLQVTLYGPLGDTPALQLPQVEGPSVAIPEPLLRRLVSDLYTARSCSIPSSWMRPGRNWGACWSAGPTSMKACCWTWKCMADERLRVPGAAWMAQVRDSLNRAPVADETFCTAQKLCYQ